MDLLETDCLSMLPLPPLTPPIGLNHRIRLGRDYQDAGAARHRGGVPDQQR